MREERYETLEAPFKTMLLNRLGQAPYARKLGFAIEELRKDYCRMRMPYDSSLDQPMGVVHGGAIASLIDTVVVGSIFSRMKDVPKKLATIDMHVHYLAPLVKEDAVAEGWVRRRGRSIVFLGVEVLSASGAVVAHGELSYFVAV